MLKASLQITERFIICEDGLYGFKDEFEETYKYRRDYLSEHDVYDMNLNSLDEEMSNNITFKIYDCKEQSVVLKFYNIDKCIMLINEKQVDFNNAIELSLQEKLIIQLENINNKKHCYEIQLVDVRKGNLFISI